MRILYLLNTLGIGGAERLVIALSERMAARGHDVRIVTLREPLPAQWPTRVEVVAAGMGKDPLSVLRGSVRLVRMVRRFQPEIVHSHNYHGNVLARVLKIICPSIRVVSTLHNEYEGGWARMLALKLTDGLSERTFAVSEAVAERATQLGIVPERKCSVICNGIDVGEFMPDSSRRAAVRAALGAANDFIWLTAGRIAAAKDYPNLLRAFALVRETVPRTQLWIAGEGESDYAAALRFDADELGLGPFVHWLGLRFDMAALLDAADGFVLASAWEGMPLALAEAMAMEKPVVATAVGGVTELVDYCGLVIPPRNAQVLARAMLSILHTPVEARQFLARCARERIIGHFNIENKAEEWEKAYSEIRNRRSATANAVGKSGQEAANRDPQPRSAQSPEQREGDD